MNLLNELQMHSAGMTELKLSIGITDGDKTTRLFYDGKTLSEAVPDYIYEIGSVTKTFTTGLLSKAISENKISLESRVFDFFPELTSDGILNPTVLELATHRSGYSRTSICRRRKLQLRLKSVFLCSGRAITAVIILIAT